MKIMDLNPIMVCVFSGLTVDLSSVFTGFDFILRMDENSKIEVSIYSDKEEVSIELFETFRNGDKEHKDLEGFLDGWVETVNSEDTVVTIY